jgi:PAS domain S-box-containing protein
MAQMLGYPDTASLVAVAAPAVYADPDDRRRQVVERLARGGILKDVEIRWRRRDGEAIWVRTDVRGVQGPDGGVRYYEGAVQDITETRRVQDALAAAQDELVRKERLAVLGQLAGGVSHELRNPLGVIKNSVYYLRMVLPADDRVRKHLQILEREITTATRIVTDLLDFARVTPAVRVPVDVNELARDAVERNPFPGHVKVTLELCETPPPVLIDPDQIALVVGNLLRNAAQAMPDGGTLTVRTAAAGAGALVEVEDTGVGIPPERLDKIFEPLFTTKARGIGLGLPVARSLTEANGGRLLVQSEPGRGSRFTVRFAGAPEDG